MACIKPDYSSYTDGGLFTDTGENERGENEWHCDNDNEVKTVSQVKRPDHRQELVQQTIWGGGG